MQKIRKALLLKDAIRQISATNKPERIKVHELKGDAPILDKTGSVVPSINSSTLHSPRRPTTSATGGGMSSSHYKMYWSPSTKAAAYTTGSLFSARQGGRASILDCKSLSPAMASLLKSPTLKYSRGAKIRVSEEQESTILKSKLFT